MRRGMNGGGFFWGWAGRFLVGMAAFGILCSGGPDRLHAADPSCDADHDGSVGIAEAIYMLQVTSGLRPPAMAPAPAARTGQTQCWAYSAGSGQYEVVDCAGTGQDGEHKTGVARPSPRFEDRGDGTVKDNLTGLIWLKQANCPASGRTWDTALGDVAQLNTDGTMNGNDCGDRSNAGGHQSDWRLPSLFELESLRDLAYAAPCISNAVGDARWGEGDPFVGVQSDFYWSGTTSAKDPDVAWDVSMDVGEGRATFTKDYSDHVWPVRSDHDGS